MNKQHLFDSLNGLYAYDTGSIDSGLHDEGRRKRIKDYLEGLDETAFRLLLSEYVRESFLTDKRLAQGYGIEDVAHVLRWLSSDMGIDI